MSDDFHLAVLAGTKAQNRAVLIALGHIVDEPADEDAERPDDEGSEERSATTRPELPAWLVAFHGPRDEPEPEPDG